MSNKNLNFFTNNVFEYNSFSAKSEIETVYVTPGEPPEHNLKIYGETHNPLYFSFVPQKGLSLSGNAGSIIDENVLGQLLAVSDSNLDSLIEFIEKFGFIFPVSTDEYASVNTKTIGSFLNRIKALVRLMGSISGKRDYMEMFNTITFLLFTKPVTLELLNESHTTYEHEFTKFLMEYNNFPDMNRNQEAFETKKFTIIDSIYGEYKMDLEFFNAIRSNSNTEIVGSKDSFFKNIVALYTSAQFYNNEEIKSIIDFYFHFQHDVAVIKEVHIDEIEFYTKPNLDNFTEELKEALLIVANNIIAKEINFNISKITPKFNLNTLQPSWKLNSLFEALYLSIFYMKPGLELYKACENPNCNHQKYFLIPSTVTNKKYCCPACRNAAAQRRSRQKKLQNQ